MKINSTEKILFVRIQTVFIALFNYIYIKQLGDEICIHIYMKPNQKVHAHKRT